MNKETALSGRKIPQMRFFLDFYEKIAYIGSNGFTCFKGYDTRRKYYEFAED